MVLIYLPLAISFTLHGYWNITPEGEAWWLVNMTQFPRDWVPLVSDFLGSFEILIALSLFWGKSRILGAIFGFLIMFIAVIMRFEHGYLYKYQGVEVPLTYSFLFLAILRDEWINHKETSVLRYFS